VLACQYGAHNLLDEILNDGAAGHIEQICANSSSNAATLERVYGKDGAAGHIQQICAF